MSANLIFIIGRQRSGTTVFRDLLMRHGAVDCDEIFHGNLINEFRFFRYVREKVKDEPDLVHPENFRSLFHDYVGELRKAYPGKKLAMDVKYFGLNLIPGHEDVDNSTPFIVNFIKGSDSHVAHIVRRNKLKIIVSEEMARKTGRWSSGRVEHLVSDKPKISIDANQIVDAIDRLVRQDEKVSAIFSDVGSVVRLNYHEMFSDDGMFSAKVQETAAAFLDVPSVTAKPGNLKMNPEPLSELVENYGELSECILASKHSWMLTDNG